MEVVSRALVLGAFGWSEKRYKNRGNVRGTTSGNIVLEPWGWVLFGSCFESIGFGSFWLERKRYKNIGNVRGNTSGNIVLERWGWA